MPLMAALRRKIENEGPLTVADYMRICLTDPQHGYYTTRTPFGAEGDFTTAPEISQIFGEMLGLWCAQYWQAMGSAARCHMVELGPGRGTLMADMLRATRHVPGFHDALEVHLVDVSAALRTVQKQTLSHAHSRLHWHEVIPALDGPCLFIANEFFDALPIHQYQTTGSGFRERLVDWEDGLVWRWGETTSCLPHPYPACDGQHIEKGKIVEACPEAQAILWQLTETIETYGGALLAVDYGYTQSPAFGDTLQAVKAHRYHDVLADPGTADLTAHVDMATLAQIARDAGLHAAITTQGAFLQTLGGAVRLQQLSANAQDDAQRKRLAEGYTRLVAPEAMGELFKVLAVVPSGMPTFGFTEETA